MKSKHNVVIVGKTFRAPGPPPKLSVWIRPLRIDPGHPVAGATLVVYGIRGRRSEGGLAPYQGGKSPSLGRDEVQGPAVSRKACSNFVILALSIWSIALAIALTRQSAHASPRQQRKSTITAILYRLSRFMDQRPA